MKQLLLLPLLCLLQTAMAQYNCQTLKQSKAPVMAPPSIDYKERSDTFNIKHFNLQLDFTALPARQMRGRADITVEQLQPNGGTLTLDLLELQVDSVWQDQQAVSFSHNDTLLRVQLQAGTTLNQDFQLSVFYHGTPPGDGSGWGGWHQSNGYYFNLGVGFAADPHPYGRAWHPCFDNFVERATYDFNIKTVLPLKAYANGLRTNIQQLGGDTILSRWQMSDSIPSYLASVAISNYAEINDSFQLAQGSTPVQLMAKPADSLAMINSYANLEAISLAFEKAFGPYQWQKIGYASTTTGAMEHATSIHMPENLIRNNSGEDIVAHELAHHWWGNLVTCETDDHMWINEGMAEYSSHLYEEEVYSYAKYWQTVRENQYYVLTKAHIRDDGYKAIQGLNHAYVYGAHVYQKGAMVGHNLRIQLGDSLFFGGLSSLLQQNAFGHLTTAEFRDQLTTLTGVPLQDFFTDQVYSTGFASFRIDSFHQQSSAPNQYAVDLMVTQAKHHAPRLHQNTKLKLYFSFADGSDSTVTVNYSGSKQNYQFTFDRAVDHALLNYKDGQLTADTYDVFDFDELGLQPGSHTSLQFNKKSTQDSNLRIIAVQHWAGPAKTAGHVGRLSQHRFWKLVDEKGEIANAAVDFQINLDGSPQGSEGDLLANSSDSLKLFYRSTPSSPWQHFTGAEINVFGPLGNQRGWVKVKDLHFKGQIEFVLGNASPDLGLDPGLKLNTSFSIRPNPAKDSLSIKADKALKRDVNVQIFTLNGQLIYQTSLKAGERSVQMETKSFSDKVIVKIADFEQIILIQR